jgi:transglutaminase-like putative cysteine protease
LTFPIEHPTVLGQQTLVEQLWLPLPNTDGGGTRDLELLDIYPDGYEILDLGEKNQAIYWDNVPDLCGQGNCLFGARFQATVERPTYVIPWADAPLYDTTGDLFLTYTRPQRGIESDDPGIRALATDIVGGEDNPYKKVLLIQSWIQQNVLYADIGSVYPDDALRCIDQGVGDCAGQSKVFVALCRAAGIPARAVAGLLPFERGTGMLDEFATCSEGDCRATWPWFGTADSADRLSVHVWVEIYLPPLGWVQAEPDMPGFGIDKERLITQRGPFAFPGGLCAHATYIHLPLAVQGNWCGQSVGWQVGIDAERIQ